MCQSHFISVIKQSARRHSAGNSCNQKIRILFLKKLIQIHRRCFTIHRRICCKYDFIRTESLTLQADCKAAGRALTFVDIASPNRQVGHVHNVIDTSLPESRDVNARMVQFMEENL